MIDFSKSEKYRKYVIELQLQEVTVYTVWGTDMQDDEVDKLLVENSSLISFRSLDTMRLQIENMEHPYLDKQNFTNWIHEEDLSNVYNVNNVRILSDFNFNFLKNKSTSLEILNTLNLIQDFYIQINAENLDEIFDNQDVIDLKDFIYNNFFWKKRKENRVYKKMKNRNIIHLLKKIYEDFTGKIEII